MTGHPAGEAHVTWMQMDIRTMAQATIDKSTQCRGLVNPKIAISIWFSRWIHL